VRSDKEVKWVVSIAFPLLSISVSAV